MENAARIIFFLILYTLPVAHSIVTLMGLLINQRYLEPQKIRRIIHVDSEQIKLPAAENEVNKLADKFLETNEFFQCIGAIDCTHIDIAKPNKHYLDYSNRKGCFSPDIQGVCDYKHCFQDVMIK